MEYLSKQQAMELLQISTDRSLQRYVKKFEVRTKTLGVGKPSLYCEDDLVQVFALIKKGKDKHNPKAKVKAIEKKIVKEKTINKNAKLKEETKKDLSPPIIQTDNPANPLNHIGQDEFNRIIEILTDNGTYKEQDRALVLVYAINYQNYIFATLASSREDNTTTDQFGTLKLHPYFMVAKECASQMTKIASILGLGVRSRIGLELKQAKKETIFDILNQKEEF